MTLPDVSMASRMTQEEGEPMWERAAEGNQLVNSSRKNTKKTAPGKGSRLFCR